MIKKIARRKLMRWFMSKLPTWILKKCTLRPVKEISKLASPSNYLRCKKLFFSSVSSLLFFMKTRLCTSREFLTHVWNAFPLYCFAWAHVKWLGRHDYEYRPTWELHLFGFIKFREVKILNISKLINATAPRYFGKCRFCPYVQRTRTRGKTLPARNYCLPLTVNC